MNYKLPDGQLTLDRNGPIPTLQFDSNLASTHFHVQVLVGITWQMVVDDSGLGKAVPIKGGSLAQVSDFSGKRLCWDITLATVNESDTVTARLDVTIMQGTKQVLKVNGDHSITDQDTCYEYIDCAVS